MRRNIPTIFTIAITFAIILMSACIAQQPANRSSQSDQGIAQITTTDDTPDIGFEDAKQGLWDYQPGSGNETGFGKRVYFVLSRDMDETGKATSWIFGINGDNGSEFLIIDRTGWTTIKNVSLPLEEIDLESIVTPENLFSQNRAVIFGSTFPGVTERRDLELQKGIYTLTISSGTMSRSLTFNATTGTLIT